MGSIIGSLYLHLLSTKANPNGSRTKRVSELMQKYEEAFKIKHIKTTSFHPQSNGSLEKTHGVIKDMLRVTQKD